jgi:hypothetical protein
MQPRREADCGENVDCRSFSTRTRSIGGENASQQRLSTKAHNIRGTNLLTQLVFERCNLFLATVNALTPREPFARRS